MSLLRHVNDKGHYPNPTLVSIFGHVPSGLWPCLLTAAELFGIPANELICHLLMLLIKREREGRRLDITWQACTNTRCKSISRCTSVCMTVNVRAEGQVRDTLSTCCPPFTQYFYSESESVTSWAQHLSHLCSRTYKYKINLKKLLFKDIILYYIILYLRQGLLC